MTIKEQIINLILKLIQEFIDPQSENQALRSALVTQEIFLSFCLIVAIVLKYFGLSRFLASHPFLFGLFTLFISTLFLISTIKLKDGIKKGFLSKRQLSFSLMMLTIGLTYLFVCLNAMILILLFMMLLFFQFVLWGFVENLYNNKITLYGIAACLILFIVIWIYGDYGFNFVTSIAFLFYFIIIIFQMGICEMVLSCIENAEESTQSTINDIDPVDRQITFLIKHKPIAAGFLLAIICSFNYYELFCELFGGVIDGIDTNKK